MRTPPSIAPKSFLEQLRAELTELKEKFRKSSSYSSKPPSSDGPWVARPKKRSHGSVIRCQNDATTALGPCIQQAADQVKETSQKHADETSWRVAGARAWLWGAVTRIVTFFAIHSQRSAQAARATLGAGLGALVSDRFSGYWWWPLGRRQVCWAHLVRDFVAIQERGGASGILNAVSTTTPTPIPFAACLRRAGGLAVLSSES